MAEKITIIGAGIVGMCTAVALRQRGVPVLVIDEREPGTGTSFGNAGLVSIDSCIPIALPGMLKKVPKWLMDPQGPLTVRPTYLPSAAPWLLKWIRSGANLNKVSAISRALWQLHKDAIEKYRSLLGNEYFSKTICLTGQLHVWESRSKSVMDELADRLRVERGIKVQELAGDEIFDLVPGMNRCVSRAQLYENNGYVSNPYLLVQRLKDAFLASGGEFVRQKVVGLSPQGSSRGYRIITASSELSAENLVVCAGAWSGRLLEGLGVDVPLETERGYHVAFDRKALDLSLPVLHKERAFGVTPMIDNLRVAGFVEIAGLDAVPDMRREAALVSQAKHLFPVLDIMQEKSFWLGFRPSTPDSLPVLGGIHTMPGLYFGFGHGHTGITGAPASAEILADLITGTATKIDASPYAAERFRTLKPHRRRP